VKSSEQARSDQGEEKNTQPESNNMRRRPRIEVSNAAGQDIANGQVEKSPKDIDSLKTKVPRRAVSQTGFEKAAPSRR
jgi:hypothetical protein